MDVEKRIEQALNEHPGLRLLKNARQKMDIEEQLADNKPLEDVLKRVLKSSPSLARIFGMGQRLHNPFKPESKEPSDKPFAGKPHPTFFRFAGKEEGELLARAAHLESKVRVAFDTDAVDDYFTRKVDRGIKDFVRIVDDMRVNLGDYVGPNLANGRANLSFDLPDGAKAGDVVEMEFMVKDPATGVEFMNKAKFAVLAAIEHPDDKTKKKDKKPPSQKPGDQPDGQAGLDFPEVIWVKPGSPNWTAHFESLDDCLAIVDDGENDASGKWQAEYKFYLNEGNKSLQNELKFTKLPVVAVKKQFEIGVVLVGMAMIHDDKNRGAEKSKDDEKKDEDDVYKRTAEFTRAIAPIILPMIQSLGDLADEETDLSDLVGAAEAA